MTEDDDDREWEAELAFQRVRVRSELHWLERSPTDDVARAVELAYRRGFHQGVATTVSMATAGASSQELDRYEDEVHEWRYKADAERCAKAEFPPRHLQRVRGGSGRL